MGAFVASEEQVQVLPHGEVETLHAAEPALRANPNLPHSPCGCAERCLDLLLAFFEGRMARDGPCYEQKGENVPNGTSVEQELMFSGLWRL